MGYSYANCHHGLTIFSTAPQSTEFVAAQLMEEKNLREATHKSVSDIRARQRQTTHFSYRLLQSPSLVQQLHCNASNTIRTSMQSIDIHQKTTYSCGND